MNEPDDLLQSFVSPEGERRGASQIPLIFYGNMAHVTAPRFAEQTTICTLAVAGLRMLDAVLARVKTVGLLAMSRTTHPGEAESAIRLYQERSTVRRMTLYGAWDYHVGRAVTRALGCGADGISMPGIATDEHYAYVFGVLSEVRAGAAPPATAEAHVDRLRRYTSEKSPFWRQQDLIESVYY